MTKPISLSMLAATLVLAFLSHSAQAELFKLRRRATSSGCSDCEAPGRPACASDICDQCNSGAGCRSCRGHRHRFEGQDPSANCGCSGSYNYPVPPLYTYHWPGLYSQTLMTDYQSPWRFPPIRAYTEDVKPQAKRDVRQVGYRVTKKTGQITSISERMKRLYR